MTNHDQLELVIEVAVERVRMTLTVGSLFSGIGGLDLGLERAGMTVKWQCEVDPYCSRVLAKHWPNVPNLGDVTKVDWDAVEPVELVCGGFPCQPASYAGRRRGADDERWLWPEVARCLRVLRPRYVLLENVPGLLTLGFGEVATDLADCGYDFEWDCIPAAAVGAPHLRYRVWIVAHSRCVELVGAAGTREGEKSERQRVRNAAGNRGSAVSDTHGGRLEGRAQLDVGTLEPAERAPRRDDPVGLRSHVADTDCSRSQGRVFGGERAGEQLARARGRAVEGIWGTEPDVGRVAHGIPARVDRLRGLGNAVVPQVAEWIGLSVLGSRERTNE